MDSPGSNDERLQEAATDPEAMLSKKMKLLIIMLSLVLIILLIPLASNHGLPLLRPMGISVLQRLWDAMRFIAMTAAVSIGIISTSNSQKNNKAGFDGSSHHRSSLSTHRSSAPAPAIAGSSRECATNPTKSNDINMNRSTPKNRQWQDITGSDLRHEGIKGKEMDDLQKLKGKELMNDFPFSASTSDTSFNGNKEGEIYGLDQSPPTQPQSQWARSHQGGDQVEEFTQRPAVTLIKMMNSRRTLSAGNTWFFAPSIQEEEEEDYISASVGQSGRSHAGENNRSKVELQKKASSSTDEKEDQSKKGINVRADSGPMNTASMTDEYAELRMHKAAISRLADGYHDIESGKAHRRSSSVDRRRPKYDYDKQSPNQPGLKQILMDLSKERASNIKLSNLSSSSRAFSNADQRPFTRDGSNRPHHAHGSISSTTNTPSAPSIQQSMKANVEHHQSSVVSTANLPPSESNASIAKLQVLQNQADVIKIDPNGQSANQIRKTQSDTKLGSNQTLQADKYVTMGSSQIVQKQVDAEVGTVRIVQKQSDNPAKMGNSNQTLQKLADARMGSGQISGGQPHRGDATMGSSIVSDDVRQKQQRHNDENGSQATSNLLKQSSKHSRSALNLEQLEQLENNTSSMHSTRPSAPLRSSGRGKKSFSCDFGDGFTPDWLMELEPPPPPGFFDQPITMISTSPPTQAPDYISKPPNPGLKNIAPPTTVQSLVPWRSSNPIDISANYPRVTSPLSPDPQASSLHSSTGPSPGEVNRRAEEFISNFNTELIRQRQQSLERQRRYG